MRGRLPNIGAAPHLDHPAAMHHLDITHIMRHHAKVMADEQNGGAILLRKFHHQVEQVALHQPSMPPVSMEVDFIDHQRSLCSNAY